MPRIAMMTLRFERDPKRLERSFCDPSPALVFPLQSTVLTVRAGQLEQRLDRAAFGLVPARQRWSLEVHSAVAPTLTLVVHEAARSSAQREYAPHFSGAQFERIISVPRTFARTRWVDELANRYLFERHVCGKHDSAAARFLETELTKELFFLGSEALQRRTRASVAEQPTDLLRQAQAFLEAHLFEPIGIEHLAEHCHTSESTLLRAFRRELGVPPTVYLRHRRLDEALLLLESRKYSVSEVAGRIGYANLSAFTVAFTRRFKTAPSRVRPQRYGAAVLPPQGAGLPPLPAEKKMTAARKRSRPRA